MNMTCFLAALMGLYVGLTEKRGLLIVVLRCAIWGTALNLLNDIILRLNLN